MKIKVLSVQAYIEQEENKKNISRRPLLHRSRFCIRDR